MTVTGDKGSNHLKNDGKFNWRAKLKKQFYSERQIFPVESTIKSDFLKNFNSSWSFLFQFSCKHVWLLLFCLKWLTLYFWWHLNYAFSIYSVLWGKKNVTGEPKYQDPPCLKETLCILFQKGSSCCWEPALPLALWRSPASAASLSHVRRLSSFNRPVQFLLPSPSIVTRRFDFQRSPSANSRSERIPSRCAQSKSPHQRARGLYSGS